MLWNPRVSVFARLCIVLIQACASAQRPQDSPGGARVQRPEGALTCPPCREGYDRDLRAEREVLTTWQRLRTHLGSEAADLNLSCQCFGRGESVLVNGESLYLTRGISTSEQTARAVHLAHHRQHPPWLEGDDGDCADRVLRAVELEAEAHALELEARRLLSVSTQRYPFERDYFARNPGERRAWLTAYLLDHPGGDGVTPGFVVQYTARCRASAPPP